MIKNNHNKIKNNKGFTLVELMVTISIFLMISSLVIFNYGDFKSTVSLQNLTDDIALSIRKAQSFAIGARNTGGGNFNNSYGIHFSVNSNGTGLDGSDKSFILFYSPSTSKMYPLVNSGTCADGSNNCVELFTINGMNKIYGIILNNGSVETSTYGSLDISFLRPDPRAYFCYRANASSGSCDLSTISSASIIISNGQTDLSLKKGKMITVQNTGQISIQPYVFTQ